MKCYRDLSKKKKIKNMNSKMATNSKLSTTEPKNKNKLSKQLEPRMGTESQKLRSHGGLSAGVWEGEEGRYRE